MDLDKFKQQNRNEITRNNVVNIVFKKLPDFAETCTENDKEQTYLIFGELGSYFIDLLQRNMIEKIKTLSDVLNEIMQSNDVEVHNLVVVGVFEALIEVATFHTLLRSLLKGKALEEFDNTIKTYS